MSLSTIIAEYWGIILFGLGLVFHALWIYFKSDNHEKRITKLEDNHDNMVEHISEVKQVVERMDGKLDILVKGYRE